MIDLYAWRYLMLIFKITKLKVACKKNPLVYTRGFLIFRIN